VSKDIIPIPLQLSIEAGLELNRLVGSLLSAEYGPDAQDGAPNAARVFELYPTAPPQGRKIATACIGSIIIINMLMPAPMIVIHI
jgi:hypothetical protein